MLEQKLSRYLEELVKDTERLQGLHAIKDSFGIAHVRNDAIKVVSGIEKRNREHLEHVLKQVYIKTCYPILTKRLRVAYDELKKTLVEIHAVINLHE